MGASTSILGMTSWNLPLGPGADTGAGAFSAAATSTMPSSRRSALGKPSIRPAVKAAAAKAVAAKFLLQEDADALAERCASYQSAFGYA